MKRTLAQRKGNNKKKKKSYLSYPHDLTFTGHVRSG